MKRMHFNETHGHAKIGKCTRTYYAWTSMRQRCENKKKNCFSRYGGRGIKVCERWQQFEYFLADMGECPPKMTLGRIDNDGNYEANNCRWETVAQQNRNRSNTVRITAFGKTQSLAEWARESGQREDTLRYRLTKMEWPAELALSKPLIGNGDPQHFKKEWQAYLREIGEEKENLQVA